MYRKFITSIILVFAALSMAVTLHASEQEAKDTLSLYFEYIYSAYPFMKTDAPLLETMQSANLEEGHAIDVTTLFPEGVLFLFCVAGDKRVSEIDIRVVDESGNEMTVLTDEDIVNRFPEEVNTGAQFAGGIGTHVFFEPPDSAVYTISFMLSDSAKGEGALAWGLGFRQE